MDLSRVNLDKLKQITPRLSELVANDEGDCVHYDLEEGTCFGINLLARHEVGVQNCFISKGSRFPLHRHDAMEWLIVYLGRIKVYQGEDTLIRDVLPGQGAYIEAGMDHWAYAEQDTWMVGISIPHTKGYPNGKRKR